MANRLKLLHKLYTDDRSPVFLTKNIDYLLKFTKKHPQLRQLTKSEILAYTSSLSDIARDREKRILRGRKRYLSHRRWIVHAPCNIGAFFYIFFHWIFTFLPKRFPTSRQTNKVAYRVTCIAVKKTLLPFLHSGGGCIISKKHTKSDERKTSIGSALYWLL